MAKSINKRTSLNIFFSSNRVKNVGFSTRTRIDSFGESDIASIIAYCPKSFALYICGIWNLMRFTSDSAASFISMSGHPPIKRNVDKASCLNGKLTQEFEFG